MTEASTDELLAHLRRLIDDGLFASAEILGSLLLARCNTEAHPARERGDALALYADALFGKGEHKRARSYYRRAVERRRGAGEWRGDGEHARARDEVEARLRGREAECGVHLDEAGAAIGALEAVPLELRSAKARALLGKLYLAAGLKRNAITAFESALQAEPLCLEVVEPLQRLKASHTSTSFDEDAMDVSSTLDDGAFPWLTPFSEAHQAHAQHNPERAAQAWGAVENKGDFHGNLYGLCRRAVARAEAGDDAEARVCFARARAADPLNVDAMDHCALLLKRRGGAEDELTALARDLVSADRKRPEAWLAVACNFDAKGDRDAALQFVDKAIQLDARHVLAFRLRGELLLAQGKAEHAIVAYFQANNVTKDLASYRGLVLAYLQTRKYKEALCTAKEAVATLPQNAAAVALVGRVLATSPDGAEKATRVFQKALQLDASCADAALALADLHAQRGDCDDAAELLTRALSARDRDVLHTKLGDVYVIAGEERYPEALASYHAALSLNPASDAALTGLDRLEKLMQGVDPDLSDEPEDSADEAPDTANSAEDVEALDSAAYL